jgi:16S rRNA (guanine527-N7)-methyltransferase
MVVSLPALRTHIDEMARAASRIGLTLDDRQLSAFEAYAALLREWNERVNLTSIVEPAEIATKHFLDSLTAIAVRRWRGGERVVDVGSGAGFPGIPLAIALPDARVSLVESVAKKVRFIEEVTRALALLRVEVLHGRAEELSRASRHREGYDVATARALPGLAMNLELLVPFLRRGGDALVYKGKIDDELPAAQRAATALGAELAQIVPTASLGLAELLPGRQIIVARKVRATPARFPRRMPEMRRRPW